MESTPSVLAKVMGLDEPPPQQPVQKQRRVLSENYLRRVASIGVRERRYSFRLKLDQKEGKDVFEVVDTLEADKNDSLSVEKGKAKQNEFHVSADMMDCEDDDFLKCLRRGNSLTSKDLFNLQVSPSNSQFGDTTSLKSNCTSGIGNVDVCRKSRRKYEQPDVTLFQKLENGIVKESLGEVDDCNSTTFSRSRMEPQKEGCFPGTRIVLKPKHGKVENSARCLPSLSYVDKKLMEFPSPGSGRAHVEVNQRKHLESDMESINLMSTVSRGAMGKLSSNTKCTRTELMRLSCLRSQSFPCSESCIARESEENFSERRKMPKKFEAVGMVGKGIALENPLSMPANQTGPRKLDYKHGRQFPTNRKLVRHDQKDLDLSKFRTQQDKYAALCTEWNVRPKRSINWGHHKSRECKFNQNDDLSPLTLRSSSKKLQSSPGVELTVNHTNEKSSRTSKKRLFGHRARISAENNDDPSSHVTDDSVQQETSSDLSKGSPFLLHCSTTERDCMMNFEEAYEPSPVSVLEPLFRAARSPTPEFLQSINVDINEYSDTYSEGSEMVVSSDDDFNEESASSYQENEDLMRLSRVEESRDFSYLVDVISEIGFYGWNTEMDFGAWQSAEWPLSLSVFETLEKKFGDQLSWKRSDRRLLFDRINAGLMEIVEPWMGVPAWTKPVSRRIRSRPGEEMIEEDVWMLLVSQEKEIRRDSAEKVLGSEIELDLRDDIDGIAREIERFLMDELVLEFISMESYEH